MKSRFEVLSEFSNMGDTVILTANGILYEGAIVDITADKMAFFVSGPMSEGVKMISLSSIDLDKLAFYDEKAACLKSVKWDEVSNIWVIKNYP